MRSDIYTAAVMNNDAGAALQEAVQKVWRAAEIQHRDTPCPRLLPAVRGNGRRGMTAIVKQPPAAPRLSNAHPRAAATRATLARRY